MASMSRSPSRSRSRSPINRKMRTERFSYRDAPYRRDSRRGFRCFDNGYSPAFGLDLIPLWNREQIIKSRLKSIKLRSMFNIYNKP